jgi:hypothetical protein
MFPLKTSFLTGPKAVCREPLSSAKEDRPQQFHGSWGSQIAIEMTMEFVDLSNFVYEKL